MTGKEFIENIGTVSTEKILDTLEFIGCDGYYKDFYYPAIEELRRRMTNENKTN
jgi:hypothetical protein